MFQVEKRDGTIAEFQMKKITDAIGKAFGAKDMQFSDDMLQMLALRVTAVTSLLLDRQVPIIF